MDGKLLSQINNSSFKLAETASKLAEEAKILSYKIDRFSEMSMSQNVVHTGVDPFIFAITIFVLSCFIGYYVVWKVTPALHTPLMSVTNAISGIIIIGAIISCGVSEFDFSKILGFFAVLIASINIFGGFVVTQRMLAMFRKN